MAKVPLNVRIEPGLREQLTLLAKEENRPLSNLVETVLKQHVAATRTEPKKLITPEFQNPPDGFRPRAGGQRVPAPQIRRSVPGTRDFSIPQNSVELDRMEDDV